MARRYDSFVLRRWQVSGEQRIKVEHMQSGGRMRADNLHAAFTWIDVHCRETVERDSVVDPAVGGTEEVIPSEQSAANRNS